MLQLSTNGELIYGESNTAGESGHMTVDPNGRLCHCGSRGCLETYSSGPALAKHYATMTGESISGAVVTRRALAGDSAAIQILLEAGQALGIAIASLAMTLNIEQFVIGGSVAGAGDLLLDPARESLKGYSFRAVAARVKIAASTLGRRRGDPGCRFYGALGELDVLACRSTSRKHGSSRI